MAVSARKRIWGWWFFDWASQPYNTLLLTFIFGPYFAEVARAHFIAGGMEEVAAKAAAQSYWAFGLTASSVVVAVLAPILGAIADGSGRRLFWIWVFSAAYVTGALGLWWVLPDAGQAGLGWAVVLFGIGFIGMEFTTIFTNAMMPSLTDKDDIGTISGSGFAFGYLGGLTALILMLVFLAESATTGKTLIGIDPLFGLDATAREGTRAVGPFAALWYAVFMIPFFLWVREPPAPRGGVRIGKALAAVASLIASLRTRTSLGAYLASSLCYRDALNALYAFGGIYASNVLGWSITQIGVFGILGGITAMAACWISGRIDTRSGPKPVIRGSIIVLIAVCTIIVGMTREQIWGMPLDPGSAVPDIIFYVCGGIIGAAGGPLQASSRTMLLRHAAPERATEAFGIFALSGKVASFISPLLVGIVSHVSTSPNIGLSPVVLLFFLGLVCLKWVNAEGERTQ